MENLIKKIENELIGKIELKSINPKDPIVVSNIPIGWTLLGNGNYAAVLFHEDFPEYVVKIYAPGREGIKEESLVYKKIGDHPSYSKYYYYGSKFLIFKRLHGTTLYDCLKKGIKITPNVIEDIDNALKYAKKRDLNPHDVHFKNVMLDTNGRGIIVDISDFTKKQKCNLWKDSKKFYFKFYARLPFIIPLPEFILNTGRKTYRLYKKIKGKC